VDFSVEEIGRRIVDGKNVVGFRLKNADNEREIIVWADAKNKLPVLMEETSKNAEGQYERHFITDIVFDTELDKSLFSLETPPGYKFEQFKYDPVVIRLMSAKNMDRILKTCREYVSKHNGQWPESLQKLDLPDIDVSRYIYLKPDVKPDESTIVLYEDYVKWENGINVGLSDYRVQFIKDETEFQKLLKQE